MALEHRLNSAIIARVAFVLLIVACVVPLGLRTLLSSRGPSVEIVDAQGGHQTISLAQMKTKPNLEREGSYQNQYGNWSESAAYRGVLVKDLLEGAVYTSIDVVASDGYRMTLERDRVEDTQFPMVLAYQKDGIEVPNWEDGFCIAVLPEDGGVSNVEYGAESAGSYWVRQVAQLIVTP